MATTYDAMTRWGNQVIGYPDPAVETLDPRFNKYRIGSAVIERLWTGGRWLEGPVWFGDGRYLLFSDIPNNRMLRWSEETGAVTTFRAPSNFSNGNTRDREGRLVTCEHFSPRVTRTEHDGRITVLMSMFNGKRLNGPNDVVVKSDGSIWFTDPGYGILKTYEGEQSEFELPRNVYRLDPQMGDATVVADDFDRPNGIAFSPDESKVYIADTGHTHTPNGPMHIRVFDVENGSQLKNGRIFVDMRPSSPDGFRFDRDGNMWAGSGFGGDDGVHCFTPEGECIGKIHLPEPCANVCFGGQKKNRLFMTAGQSLYSLYVESFGAQTP